MTNLNLGDYVDICDSRGELIPDAPLTWISGFVSPGVALCSFVDGSGIYRTAEYNVQDLRRMAEDCD